jgi:hypothetical protein
MVEVEFRSVGGKFRLELKNVRGEDLELEPVISALMISFDCCPVGHDDLLRMVRKDRTVKLDGVRYKVTDCQEWIMRGFVLNLVKHVDQRWCKV